MAWAPAQRQQEGFFSDLLISLSSSPQHVLSLLEAASIVSASTGRFRAQFTPSEPGSSTLIFESTIKNQQSTLPESPRSTQYITIFKPNGPRPSHHILSLANPSPTIEHPSLLLDVHISFTYSLK